MRRLLNKQLVARCTSLGRLALRQVGIDVLQSFKILPPGWYYPGPEIHEEWTSFIRAVRPRHLILQYDDVCSKTRAELKKKTEVDKHMSRQLTAAYKICPEAFATLEGRVARAAEVGVDLLAHRRFGYVLLGCLR